MVGMGMSDMVLMGTMDIARKWFWKMENLQRGEIEVGREETKGVEESRGGGERWRRELSLKGHAVSMDL
jgi:hypothetical protein